MMLPFNNKKKRTITIKDSKLKKDLQDIFNMVQVNLVRRGFSYDDSGDAVRRRSS